MTADDFRGFYPGSKVPLPTGPTKQDAKPEQDAVSWDARPYKKFVRGKEVEFFTIGALGTALNKKVVTIRQWISKGYIPQATFRLPAKNNIAGRRLYTREQIEAVIAVAKRHNILDEPRVNWSKHRTFASEVLEAWNQLPPL